MPHDKNGAPLQVGDKVTLECVIKSICEGEFCTTDVTTCEVMPGNNQPNQLSALNAKQFVKVSCDVEHKPNLKKVGLSLDSVKEYAEKSIHLLSAYGNDMIDLVDSGFRAYAAFSSKDYIGVLNALNDTNRTAQTLIAAFKAEFNL